MNGITMKDTGMVRTINLTDATLLSEGELLARARQGDKSAFGTLYLRHRDSARKVASMCVASSADVDDAVAEGFARVFAALPRMTGRELEFRPYLLTCVRNAATDRVRRSSRVDLRESLPDVPGAVQADDVALLGLERNLVGEALQALPSRWRTVLWLTEVEGLSPGEVADHIGIKPNAVSALAYRARKGLREAYLQAHLRAEASGDCRATVSRLGNYVRGELPDRDRATVVVHLDGCAKCRCRRDELTDVNATLRNAFLPLPLLFAGVQRRWFSALGSEPVLSRVPEASQMAAALDSPLTHKALATIAMAVLALSGAAAPKIVGGGSGADRPTPLVQALSANGTGERGPIHLNVTPIDVIEAASAAAFASGGTASIATTSAPAGPETQAAPPVRSGGRGRLLDRFGGGRSGDEPQREGESRQTFFPGPDEGAGGAERAVLGSVLGPVVEQTSALIGGVVPGVDAGPVLGVPVPIADQLLSETVGPLLSDVDAAAGSLLGSPTHVGPVAKVLGAVADILSPLADFSGVVDPTPSP